jgi:hypothetical protein
VNGEDTARPLFGVVLGIRVLARTNRIAHMNVSDRRSRLGGLDRGGGDLLRRHRNARVLAYRIARAGNGTAYNHFIVHRPILPAFSYDGLWLDLLPYANRLTRRDSA